MNLLACDLGGTKVLIGIYSNNDNRPKLLKKEKYLSSEWDSIYQIIEDFLFKKCIGIQPPEKACFGIAGPVNNHSAKITNLNWEIDELVLKKSFNLKSVELINDFAVLLYGIPFLKESQYMTIQNGAKLKLKKENLHTIVGAGTGLGVSRGLISEENIFVLASEGGHVEFAPKTNKEWEIKLWLQDNLKVDRISNERIVSGEGLLNIANWRFSKKDLENHPFKCLLKTQKSSTSRKKLPEKICELASQGDHTMLEIEKIWLDAYASFIGDLAVHELCYGGLWIAGGTASKHSSNFKSDSFLKQILNKGRLKDIVRSIPIRVILDEDLGLHSAACKAQIL